MEVFLHLAFVIGLAVGLLLLNSWVSKIKASVEKGKTPLLTMKCGAFSSLYSVSYNMARLTCYEDFLVLGFLIRVVIFYSKIKEIKAEKRFIGYGLRVIYEANLYDEKVRFLFLKREEVLKLMEFF